MQDQHAVVASHDEFLSVAELAAELHVTERFIRRLIADGELEAVRIGSRLVRVRRSAVDHLLHPLAMPAAPGA
ncbi:helix-turn-helix transcriptional regulator [Cellulomonas endophytica]|uniref:helix-turn-helix transcriptional regulator n=1 Tax=Cellulomonas endophytica TaxID=2494735 RepID=UPI0010123DB2|nr:helix-turn-helix domain-containing protein [Cellulomonas endophytica]